MTKFEEALRELDPYSRDSHPGILDERATADLESIVNGQWGATPPVQSTTDNVVPLRHSTAPRRSWVKWSVAAVAVIALAIGTSVSGVLDGSRGNDAVAVSLPALVPSPGSEPKSEVVEDLLRRALATADAPDYDPQQYSLYEIGETYTDESPGNIGPVAKTHITVEKDEKGVMIMTATTEGAFGSDGRMIEYRSSDGSLIKPGTTKTSSYMGPMFPQPTGQDSTSLRIFVQDFQTEATALINPQKGLAVTEVMGYALQEWNFSQKQSAGLLELIGQNRNIKYSGQVTDRMGRKGIAFSSEVPDAYNGATRHSLIFDTSTGKLNAYEEVYLQGDEFPEGSTRKSVTSTAP